MTQKYRFVSSMTYELPFGKGKAWMNKGGMLDRVLGGCSLSRGTSPSGLPLPRASATRAAPTSTP